MTPSAAHNTQQAISAFHNGAAVFDLSDRARIEVKGADRTTFLHALLTQSINRLNTNTGCYAAFLNTEGRMLTDLYLYKCEDHILLDVPPGRAPALLDGLGKLLITEDVELKDISATSGMISIQGPTAAKVLSALGVQTLPKDPLSVLPSSLSGPEAILIRHSRWGADGFDIFTEKVGIQKLIKAISDKGAGSVVGSFEAFRALYTEAGCPLFGQDMDEKTIPLEAELEAAMDHDKGCYIGQEIVARIRDRGHVAKILVRFRVKGPELPQPGAPISQADKPIGQVTSVMLSEKLGQVVGLGYVKWEQRSAQDLEIRGKGQPMRLTIF